MLSPGDAAPDVALHDHTGQSVKLSQFWRRPVVLFFERHLGCPFCREHVANVRDDYQRFRDAGAEVVVVTMGTPKQAAAFREERKAPFACLADPEQQAYRAYEIPRGGMNEVAGVCVWGAGLRATLRGGVRRPQGDLQQLHGVVIVDAAGVVRYVYRPKNSADIPANEVILHELQALTEDSTPSAGVAETPADP
ncbi:MAG: peroxiredoxin-like family protein [Pirellulaceae bacterium]